MQSVIERLDNSFFDIATTDRAFTSLPKVRHLAGIYVEILPDVIRSYQIGKDNWLQEYGYERSVESSKLKALTNTGKTN